MKFLIARSECRCWAVRSSNTFDLNESSTLRRVVSDCTIAVRTDPLWLLIITAVQGHEGAVEEMRISTASGTEYGPSDIQKLARRPDRQWD